MASNIEELHLVQRFEVGLLVETVRYELLEHFGLELLLPEVDLVHHQLRLRLTGFPQLLHEGVLTIDESRNLRLLVTGRVDRGQLLLHQLALPAQLLEPLLVALRV